MFKNLHISILLLTFAVEIVGGHVPANGGFSTSPFSVCKVELIKKVDIMPKRLNTEEFIRRARLVHGDKYDYSKVAYVNTQTKVCIICHEHGEFWQQPQHHLKGSGCPSCGFITISQKGRMTTTEFIYRARQVHGDKYSYEKTEYIKSDKPVTITCDKHGDFEQVANAHLSGCGCPLCKNNKIHMLKNKGIEKFIFDARTIHGDKYDYSESVYVDNKTPLAIICNRHGLFMQTPQSHLKGCGCPKCADEKTGDRCRMTLEEFLLRAKETHGDKYDYSLVTKDTFVDAHTDIEIICQKHGKYKQTPSEHLGGYGCYWCGKESMAQKQALTRDDVVRRCNEIFDNKYDYSLFTEYHSKKDIIQVICPKHGAWAVSVNNHLYRQSGCPSCKRSFGEERIARFLDENHIEYTEQYRIKNESLLCINMYMMIDFFLPKYNIAIEYNGIQHYEENPLFDTRNLEQQQRRDDAVRSYCKNHGIKLIEIPYTEYDNIEKLLKKNLKKYT